MTNEEYRKYAGKHAPRSHVGRNCLGAFLVGGAICCLGQALLDLYGAWGLDEQAAAAAESVTLVFLGALLTGLGIYDDLARLGGAGTLVPITGFANSVAAPAIEFQREGAITGVGARLFTLAGPVLAYGIAASVAVVIADWLVRGWVL